jgi:serine protease AprX
MDLHPAEQREGNGGIMRQENRQRRGGSTRPDERANALWGGGKKLVLTLATLVVLLALAAGQVGTARAGQQPAYTSPGLLADATAHPTQLFDVIVQARQRGAAADAGATVAAGIQGAVKDRPARGSGLHRRFASILGSSATLSGTQIVRLSTKGWVESITLDSKVKQEAYSTSQVWPSAADVTSTWNALPAGTNYPAMAIVDSGVASLPTFGTRLVKSVNLVSSSTNTGTSGHGTFVASIAAGEDTGFTGAEPHAKIVSLKVLDGNGAGRKSDVIAACDWILQNKSLYNIRVANFSLNTGGDSIQYDALDKAVESLWLNGVTVVVAAGNYAVNGQRSNVGYAPANDPFVITVGASDTNGTTTRSDDFAAPWSAWGYTQDGFFKPEVAAPGRHMIGAVPTGANLLAQFPDRVVTPGYMWMSGTSFSAPVVSGIATTILAKNPGWTADQVKGAIMQTVIVPYGYNSAGALGVGVVKAGAALNASGTANPNLGLDQFRYFDGTTGRYAFDASAWRGYAASNASWNSASWNSASWNSASWNSASWNSASWNSASWYDASWADASWADASWADSSDLE